MLCSEPLVFCESAVIACRPTGHAIANSSTSLAIDLATSHHAAAPNERRAQQALAAELTELLHGEEGLRDARAATEALFSGDVRGLSAALLDEVFAGAPSAEIERSSLAAPGKSLVDILVETEIVKSKREAREFLKSGAVSVNGEKKSEDALLSTEDLLHDRLALVRRGKKTWHVLRVVDPSADG